VDFLTADQLAIMSATGVLVVARAYGFDQAASLLLSDPDALKKWSDEHPAFNDPRVRELLNKALEDEDNRWKASA